MSDQKPPYEALSQFTISVDYAAGPTLVTTRLWGHDGHQWQEVRPMRPRNGNAAAQRRWRAMSREQRAAHRQLRRLQLAFA